MKENIILEKALLFGARIVKFAEFLKNNKHRIIANQILRSGTSIGANIAESEYASSKMDFISKKHIAQKEASETKYWLILSKIMQIIADDMYKSLSEDLDELLRLVGSSLKTSKKNIQ